MIHISVSAFVHLSSPAKVVLVIVDGLSDVAPTALESARGTITFKAKFEAHWLAEDSVLFVSRRVLMQHPKLSLLA